MDDTGVIAGATLTSPKINEILDTNGNEVLGLLSTASATDYVAIKNGIGTGVPLHISSEGSSTNIGLHIQPKGSGLVTISDGTDFNKGIRFRSSGSAASAITLLDAVSTAGHVVTLPDATTTLVGRNTTDTLTNKSISGSTNTLSNIGNSSLTNSAITINGTSTSLGGSINVGTVTSVTGTAPVVSSGGATPAISMAQSSTTVDGYLSATDFTTFNNKGNGTVTSVAALTLGTSGTDLSSTVANGTTTPVITLQVPTASATNRGALSSADWTTFNSKAAPFTYTSTYIPFGQGTTTPNQSANLTFDGTSLTAPVQRASNGIVTNNKTIGTSFTIPSTDNAMSSGPVTLSAGVTVTVSSGSRWVVL
jgi:trimeric autotransporter adhesin